MGNELSEPRMGIRAALIAGIAIFATGAAMFASGALDYVPPPQPTGRIVEQIFFRHHEGELAAQTFRFMNANSNSSDDAAADLYELTGADLHLIPRPQWWITPRSPRNHYRYVFMDPGHDIKGRLYWIARP